MRALAAHLVAVLVSAAAYLAVVQGTTAWDLAAALAVGAGSVALLRPGRRGGERVGRTFLRAAWVLPLLAATTVRAIAGALRVCRETLRRDPAPRAGVVDVPMEDRTSAGMFLTAVLTSISPDSYVVDVDRERRIFRVHVLDASAPGAAETQNRFYRRWQRRVLP